MKQVTKEEYDVLTRFHPGEVRYYVDTSKELPRRCGGTRKLTRSMVTANTIVVPYSLSMREVDHGKGDKILRVHEAMIGVFKNAGKDEPITRKELTSRIAKVTGMPKRLVSPHLSNLISQGWLLTK